MMKKYIITEEQLNKALTSKITKGIGLKINDDTGEYYKSIIKTFDTDDDYRRWENNLKEGTTIIGVMDIENPQPETLQESTGDVKKKDRDIQMLERLIKKKYPFITSLEVNKIDEAAINLDIHIDLNKFYDVTKTSPPQKYIDNNWLDLLEERGLFLTRYVDRESPDHDKANKIGDNILKELNQIYKVLPKNVVHTKYEAWDDDYINGLVQGRSFFKEWRDEKEPMSIYMDHFYPQVNVDNLLLTFSQGGL